MPHSNADISANIARKWTRCILKFKLIYSEYKDICLVAIALIFYMLCEIKEEYFFGDTRYILSWISVKFSIDLVPKLASLLV